MILLDTNALLWALGDPDRLGPNTRSTLTGSSEVYYSSISITELRIKQLLERLTLPEAVVESIEDAGFLALPYSPDDADALALFPQLVRHDPFDRMLLAQATVRGCRLYTSDATLLGLALPHVYDCRR
ncbi:MAG: type II toxin-antitoxin system VapC family toxin [Propionibacterium sp.]|nr:type II toxin-antitoxin system VapC family toxin [Propionibacterium sp.]